MCLVIVEGQIEIIPEIRELLDRYELPTFLLTSEQFERLVRIYLFEDDTAGEAIAFTLVKEQMIFIDDERLHNCGFSQKFINYTLLHEIAHGALYTFDEQKADKLAFELAEIYDIEADDEDITVE